MAGSLNYARIKGQVLHILAHVPEGGLVSHAEVGEALDVPARHVAYILATLEDMERQIHPWHRAVPQSGVLGKHQRREAQLRALREEGVEVNHRGKIGDFAARKIAIDPAWVIGPTEPTAPVRKRR